MVQNTGPVVLGFMEIETAEYKHALDIFDPCDGGANPAGGASMPAPGKKQ